MTQTLFSYLQQTQRFLRDANQELLNPQDLITYINRARRQVAMQAQCLRFLTPSSGSITTIDVTDGGSGYTDPTVTISNPDAPSGAGAMAGGDLATAVANVVGGVITSIDVTYGGSGYFAPTVTITDDTGEDAEATANTSWVSQTVTEQEVYPFSDVDLSTAPGYGSILAVKSVSIIYANYRYSLPCYSFSTYQARIRQYPNQCIYVPTICSQFGQGTSGSLYMYPLPSQAYRMEWDCICLPQDLDTDQSVEAIPDPWTDGVPFLAASYAYLELNNFNAGEYYRKLFAEWIHQYSAAARPGRRINPYGGF
jgi:hypothetical protein